MRAIAVNETHRATMAIDGPSQPDAGSRQNHAGGAENPGSDATPFAGRAGLSFHQADNHPPPGSVFRLREHPFLAKRVQFLQVLAQPLGVFRLHRIPARDALTGAPDGALARDVKEGWKTAQ